MQFREMQGCTYLAQKHSEGEGELLHAIPCVSVCVVCVCVCGGERSNQSSAMVLCCLLRLWGEDLPFLKDQLVGCGAVHLLVGQTSLEFKPGLHRNTVLEKQKQQETHLCFSDLKGCTSSRLLAILRTGPQLPGEPFLLLSLLTPWAETSWIDGDSVSLGWESADIHPSSKGLGLLRTKTKSPGEQNVLYQGNPS